MTDRFPVCLPIILKAEGGFVEHPADPGGATHHGITQHAYDRWRAAQGQTPRPVEDIAPDEVVAIYAEDYWTPAGCEDLPVPLDLIQFDTAVQYGPTTAVKMLQSLVGASVDGLFGAETRRLAEAASSYQLCRWYLESREARYRARVQVEPSQQVFLSGWLSRLSMLKKAAGLE